MVALFLNQKHIANLRKRKLRTIVASHILGVAEFVMLAHTVMLVLLIMLIITIPVQTHAVKLDLPVQQPNQPPPPINPVKNDRVDQRPGSGACGTESRSTMSQLRQYLDTTQQMNPIPELHLQPDATARYEMVDEVLAVTKQAHVQKMGFVGNEYYTQHLLGTLKRTTDLQRAVPHPRSRPFLFEAIAWSLALPEWPCHCSADERPAPFRRSHPCCRAGTRMRSDTHKVLHPIASRPLALHLLDRVDGSAPTGESSSLARGATR